MEKGKGAEMAHGTKDASSPVIADLSAHTIALVVSVDKYAHHAPLTTSHAKVQDYKVTFEALGIPHEALDCETHGPILATKETVLEYIATRLKERVHRCKRDVTLLVVWIGHGGQAFAADNGAGVGPTPHLCVPILVLRDTKSDHSGAIQVNELGYALRQTGIKHLFLAVEACNQSLAMDAPAFGFLRALDDGVCGISVAFATLPHEKTADVDIAFGRGIIDCLKSGQTASVVGARLMRELPVPPAVSVITMEGGRDFCLGAPAGQNESMPLYHTRVNEWKREAQQLIDTVQRYSKQYPDETIQRMLELQRVKDWQKLLNIFMRGLDNGLASHRTPDGLLHWHKMWAAMKEDMRQYLLDQRLSVIQDQTTHIMEHIAAAPEAGKSVETVAARQEGSALEPFALSHDIHLDRGPEMQSVLDFLRQNKALVGICGMGGVGKTVLAHVLWDNAALRQMFPDGKFWVDVGSEPEPHMLLRAQNTLYNSFVPQDQKQSFVSSGEAQKALERILPGKRCLIVLDDVWKESDKIIESFGFSAVRSQPPAPTKFLITTRNSEVCSGRNGNIHPVQCIGEKDSLTLLAASAHVAVRELKQVESTKALLKAAGGLPLAISLLGAAIASDCADGESLADSVSDLQSRHAILGTSILPDAEAAVALSVERFSRARELRKCGDLTARFLDLGVFPEDAHIPQSVVTRWWRLQHGLPESIGRTILKELSRRSLLSLTVSQHPKSDDRIAVDPAFRLHDIIRLYARDQCEEEESGLRRRFISLIQCYFSLCNGKPPKDGAEVADIQSLIDDLCFICGPTSSPSVNFEVFDAAFHDGIFFDHLPSWLRALGLEKSAERLQMLPAWQTEVAFAHHGADLSYVRAFRFEKVSGFSNLQRQALFCLFQAIEQNDSDLFQRLLSTYDGTNLAIVRLFSSKWVGQEQFEATTLLQRAAILGRVSMVQALLGFARELSSHSGLPIADFLENCDFHGHFSRSALHFAIEGNQVEVVDLLLRHGFQDSFALCDKLYCREEYGIDGNVGCSWARLAGIHMAIAKGYDGITKCMIEKGMFCRERSALWEPPIELPQGCTPFQLAVIRRRHTAARLLLAKAMLVTSPAAVKDVIYWNAEGIAAMKEVLVDDKEMKEIVERAENRLNDVKPIPASESSSASSIPIQVKDLKGDTINLEVTPECLVETIRTIIREKTKLDIPPNMQQLTFCGHKLEDGRSLRDYRIQRYSTLLLNCVFDPESDEENEGTFTIFVKMLNGMTVPADVDSEMSVLTLKQELYRILPTPPEEQRLIYAGKQLEDDHTIGDYGMRKHSTVHLVLRLRGG